jgi:aquaporin Z
MTERGRIFVAELVGTLILVTAGPGAAIFAGSRLAGGVIGGTLGVALAFGLSLLCAAYLFGSISGCHINPAVTIGLWAMGKTKTGDVPVYIGAQIIGGALGALVIWGIIKSGDLTGPLANTKLRFAGASNGWGSHSPQGYGFGAMAITEIVFTALFVLVILSTTRKSMPPGFTGIAVGLMLAVVHLISIPIDNTSVNPARSLATALFAQSWALEQVWAFFVFPIIGGLVAAFIWRAVVPAQDA